MKISLPRHFGRYAASLALGCLLATTAASAHQPRLVSGPGPTVDREPEISRAFYGELAGQPANFQAVSARPFVLHVSLLVPAVPGAATDFAATIFDEAGPLARLDGSQISWTRLHEPFANDEYLQGPEFRRQVPAGTYRIAVVSGDLRGRYVLVVGDREDFPPAEILHALAVIPHLKTAFFGKLPADFALSVFGAIYLALLLVAGAALAGLVRLLARLGRKRRLFHRQSSGGRNLGTPDRWVRLLLAVLLLAAGLMTWNAVLLLAAGYLAFEAATAWCALYAALGKNTA